MKDTKYFAMLGATLKDKNGKEVKKIVTVPRESIPEGLTPGDETIIELDGEKASCVLLGVGGYDPKLAGGPPTPEEIMKLVDEHPRPYFYPAKEAEIDDIEKNGIPGEKITLAETPEEAAILGAMKYKTKENKIKTLALVIVNIPISARLEETTIETPAGDILHAVETAQAIPPDWISETAFIDFREGGLFA